MVKYWETGESRKPLPCQAWRARRGRGGIFYWILLKARTMKGGCLTGAMALEEHSHCLSTTPGTAVLTLTSLSLARTPLYMSVERGQPPRAQNRADTEGRGWGIVIREQQRSNWASVCFFYNGNHSTYHVVLWWRLAMDQPTPSTSVCQAPTVCQALSHRYSGDQNREYVCRHRDYTYRKARYT